MAVWYCGSTKWSSVTPWAATTAYSIGDLRRQLATPTWGNERVFRCTTAGTSGGTEPTWTLTKGGTTNDGTAVWTEVTGNSAYGWSAPHATIATMLGWMAAGDTGYVSSSHSATKTTASSLLLTAPASTTLRTRVLCVSDASAPPTTLATGAAEGSNQNQLVGVDGPLYVYGVRLFANGAGASSNVWVPYTSTVLGNAILDTCTLHVANGRSDTFIVCGGTGYNVSQKTHFATLIKPTFKFSHASQTVYMTGLDMRGGSVDAAGTIPTKLFSTGDTNDAPTANLVRQFDASALGVGKTLLAMRGAGDYLFVDCAIGSSAALTDGPFANLFSGTATIINTDSANTVYRYYRQNYCATEQHETTIVRTGGASDGTTTVSRKIVSTANSSIVAPYESQPLEFWNTNLSAQQIVVPVLTDNVTLTDADAWIEVEYLGTSGNPLGVIVSGRMSDPIFGTPANHATDSTSVWTTTGLGTPVKQKLVSPSFTAQKSGLIRVWVKVARASTTLYYDPKALSTSGRQYMSEAGVVNEGAGGGVSRGRVVNS